MGNSLNELQDLKQEIEKKLKDDSQNEEYQKDGSWVGIMEMSAASYNKLEDVLGSVTKGTAETKIL